MNTLLKNAQVLLGNDFLPGGCVLVDGTGKIAYAGPQTAFSGQADTEIDLHGQYLSPGLIDIHVHGGYGVRFGVSDQVEADLEKYRGWVTSHGVTGFLTSVIMPTHERLLQLLEQFGKVDGTGGPGAEFLGVHLEGPYINPQRKGAIDPLCLREVSLEEGRQILATAGTLVRQITIAPEIPGGMELASLFDSAGVTVALGHTTADYDIAHAAYQGPFHHTTHVYNAQTGLAHRAPGVVGALLSDEHATGELIADLFHVHPAAIHVLLNCLGTERVALITDAMCAAGLPDGTYVLSGRERVVAGGKSVLPDGTIAGSTATLDQCIRNMVQTVGYKPADALNLASRNPARIIHVDDRVGSIEAGKMANLIVLDDDLVVRKTFVRGSLVYEG